MQSWPTQVFHAAKVAVNELIFRKLFSSFYTRHWGKSRLCAVLTKTQAPPGVDYEVLYKPLALPRNEVQFCIPGKITQDYLTRLATYGNDFTFPAGVISANNVDVSFPIGMHSCHGKFFWEAVLNEEVLLVNPKYVLDLETIPFKRKTTIDEAVLLSTPIHHNFFHWLIEILPRLQLYEQLPGLQQLPLIVPKSSARYVKESLELVGYRDRVQFLDDGVYQFKRLHLLSRLAKTCDGSPIALKWLNQAIPSSPNSPRNRRLYISRRDAKIRFLTNENDAQTVLSDFGFETIVMSDYSLADQIELFRQAEIIVGNHGAAFAHLAFAHPGTKFIEFFEQGHFSHCYYRICSLRNLQYGFLVGEKNGLGFSIDPEDLRTLIQTTLCDRANLMI